MVGLILPHLCCKAALGPMQHALSTSQGPISFRAVHVFWWHAGTRDVVFFQHGVLDTSLGWVANGSVGSQVGQSGSAVAGSGSCVGCSPPRH